MIRSRPPWPFPNNQSLYETRGGSPASTALPLVTRTLQIAYPGTTTTRVPLVDAASPAAETCERGKTRVGGAMLPSAIICMYAGTWATKLARDAEPAPLPESRMRRLRNRAAGTAPSGPAVAPIST